MIIDVHAHLGEDVVFDEACTEEALIAWHDRFGVEKMIVQPFIPRTYLQDHRAIHDRIAALCKAYPGRVYGMASIHPHFTREDYVREAERCVASLGFVGLKMTPIAHAVRPDSRDGRMVFDTARMLNVPLMIHTGSGAPFADPAGLAHVVEDYPDVPVILAHAGTDLLFAQALQLAERHAQVYLEPSWLSILCVQKALDTLGPTRLLFSSDHCENLPVELAKYRTVLAGDDLDLVLGGNAQRLFRLGV